MCVFCVSVLSPCLQVCVVPKISRPPQSSKLMPFETYVCFCKKLNKAGNSKFLKIFDFENLDFSGGARLSPFSWVDRFWIIILSKVHLWGPQNSATINFLAHCIFIQGRWILDKLIYLKEGQILGLDFPKFVQIFASVWGFIFRVCFIRKVHWETILKSTYRYSTLEFSEHLIKT